MKTEKMFHEQLRLTKWFAIIAGICGLLVLATYLWLHIFILLVIAIMFGPIFFFLTLVFGSFALASYLKLKK